VAARLASGRRAQTFKTRHASWLQAGPHSSNARRLIVQQQLFAVPAIEPVLALIATALVVMGSPGPSTISVTALGSAFGLRRSLPYLAGVIIGTSVVLVAVAAGLASVVLSQPRLAPLLLGLSALYILYLAFAIATAPPLAETPAQALAPGFTGGLLLALANPKAYVAIGAVFAGTQLGLRPELIETSVKTAILLALIVVIHLAWFGAGTAFAGLLRRPLLSRIVNLAFAAALVVTTLSSLRTLW